MKKSVNLPDSIDNIDVEVLGSNVFIFENKYEEIILSNDLKKIEPILLMIAKISKNMFKNSIKVLDGNCFCADYYIDD